MKKKCLLILPRNVFPPIGGYAMPTINIIKFLSQNYDMQVVIISNQKLSKGEEIFFKDLQVKLHYFYFPKWRFYLNAFLGLFSKYPIQCEYYTFRKVKKKIVELSFDMDVVVGRLIRIAPYLDFITSPIVKILDMTDSIALNYNRSKNKTKSIFWKIIYTIETNRLFKYETRCLKNFDATLYVNNEEYKFWSSKGIAVWTPLPVKEELFIYNITTDKYAKYIAFFGKMDYQPNVDAFLWYYNNIHQKLANPYPLIVIGPNPPKIIKDISKQDSSIKVSGFVEDPYLILNSVKACIAPMQTGGGVQNKILETMALGKINIVSTLAGNGIFGAENNNHFLIADTLSDYQKCFDMLSDSKLVSNIQDNAKELMKKQYRLNIYKNLYIDTIESYFKTI